MEKNLWDDIQIEINAEFEKVKMTIGELKQITQGQIVDLGSVFDNEISLLVEEKVVAKGELVIINDKYAVKVNKVYAPQQNSPKAQQTATANQTAPSKPLPPKPAAKAAPPPASAAKPLPPKPAAKAVPPKPLPPKPAAKPTPPPAAAQKEDFDYSDFEK